MLYELVQKIEWSTWIETAEGCIALALLFSVVVWVIPMLINVPCGALGLHPSFKLGSVMFTRIAISVGAILIVGDQLGFSPITVKGSLLSVAGLGLSLAVREIFVNMIGSATLLADQRYVIGDYISSESPRFAGVITSFHTQYIILKNLEDGSSIYLPSQFTFNSVIRKKIPGHNPAWQQPGRQENTEDGLYLNI